MDVVGILDEKDEVLVVALRVQLSVVLVAEAVAVASLVELLVAVLLDVLTVVVALVVWVDVSDVSVNVELPVEVTDKLLVVIEMLVVASKTHSFISFQVPWD